ncbi:MULTISPECIES: ATP-dependent DNA helicase RecG [unclassified Thioalkalivibrio]|uniref:ATP-dependent DNA helicase RecG n=1 Tax=unclassified Thioalkalivibrio TaxID=2621013 RepID=UPI00210141C7|nr:MULTISPECIES: ATP-dependent DNA helicase RecG [unclassified Thioalkalivibrio]
MRAATAVDLQAPLTGFKGVGPAVAERLARLGLEQARDLLLHLPLRFEDRTRLTPIRALRPGLPALFEGRVTHAEVVHRRRRMLVVTLEEDGTSILLRFFHFGSGQQRRLSPGTRIRAFGEPRGMPGAMECVHPELQVVGTKPPTLETHLTPIYPTTEGISQKLLRQLVTEVLPTTGQLPDLLPELSERQLPGLHTALQQLHHPPARAEALDALDTAEQRGPARTRLALEELTAHQLARMEQSRTPQDARRAPVIRPEGALWRQLRDQLPFKPTGAQDRVIREVREDLARPIPMNRLVQGDVGSGKTLVAVAAALAAVEAGHQVAFMAPTELLARQHGRNLAQWLEPLGVSVAWLGGRQTANERGQLLSELANGQRQVAIGTHALFQEEVRFHRLGLAIIDEQHRFGVHQRMALRDKGNGQMPHQLIMTATPIPRTLAMALYADLDSSVIDERPPGRTPVRTALISHERRDEVIERIRAACGSGTQAYWVCPLVEESEQLEAESAEATAERLCEALPELRIGLAHGRMKGSERDTVMERFRAGALDLLVATTVIEVGVDVPNASLMIIENAERMGLSQLHQLRGRVGRGNTASACVLLYRPPLGETARERLEAMRRTNDGFEIAEVDLRLRGPGELLGTRQTGDRSFRVADWSRDQDLLEEATELALRVREDPPRAAALIERWLGGATRYATVG